MVFITTSIPANMEREAFQPDIAESTCYIATRLSSSPWEDQRNQDRSLFRVLHHPLMYRRWIDATCYVRLFKEDRSNRPWRGEPGIDGKQLRFAMLYLQGRDVESRQPVV